LVALLLFYDLLLAVKKSKIFKKLEYMKEAINALGKFQSFHE